ncbi:MAG TPA: hypothetical protein VEB22_02985 [Phycisphaerales bacterium]|nr:hypothetical protein [Phycisphaerales bacterium]
MNPIMLVIPLLALPGMNQAEPVKAVRGLATTIEVDYGPRLRARADQTPTSPILVRVSRGHAGKQRIEFIGAVAGSYDLRDHLEREDGRPIDAAFVAPVSVVSNLPAGQGPDLYGSGGSWMNWRAHYRELMWGAAAVWTAVPVTVLVVRAVRRPRAVPPAPPAPPPPTVAERLRGLLETARERRLTVEESGRLELLLLRYLGADTPAHDDLAAALRALRERNESRPLVLAVEHWLHTGAGDDAARDHAATVLEELRRTRLAAPPAREVGA